MPTLSFKFVKIHPKAIVPKKTNGNLAFDLHVIRDDQFRANHDYSKWEYVLHPGEKHVFHTGLKMAIPMGYGVVFRDRSGMAAKYGISVMAGVIDSSYRGEWMVCLLNTSQENYTIVEGDRIVQAFPVLEYRMEFIEEKSLDYTARGEGGFGSSGR